MRCTLLLLLLFFNFPVNAQVNDSTQLVTCHVREMPLGEVLKEISGKYSIQFFYSASKIPVDQRISIDIEEQPLYILLRTIKTLSAVDYQITGSKVIFFAKEAANHIKRISLFGFVEDSVTGERLIGAYVLVKEIHQGAVSNTYGYYSLSLRAGEYIIRCSYVGYIPIERYVNTNHLNEDTCSNFKLRPDLVPLKEINISGKVLDKLSSAKIGSDEVPLKMMQSYPALLGEHDPIQFLKMLPGIQSGVEASNGLYVRGSIPNQTTFLLDDAPLFNISHISGLFSTINPDAIKDIRLYKSHMPAKYGGALASVVDIRLRDGDNQRFSATGGVGTIASRLTVEGPIIKNKSSFMVSARRSYLDQIVKLFSLGKTTDFGNVYFYDLNSKVNYSLNTRNRFYLSAYFSNDNVIDVNKEGINWTNLMFSFRWNHVYGSKLFSNITLTGSKYVHEFDSNTAGYYTIKTNLKHYSFKYDFTYYLTDQNQIDFGLCSNYQAILPLEITVWDNSKIISPYYSGIQDRSLCNLYIESRRDLTSSLTIEAGARVNYILNFSETLGKSDLKPEPFAMAKYKPASFFTVKAGYSRNYQFYHGESVINMILPFDRIVFTNDKLKAEYSDNISLGGYYASANHQYEVTLEGYYKKLHNLCRFKVVDELLYGKHVNDLAVLGSSEAYGLELSLRRYIGKLTGMVNYTLSKVRNKEEGLYNNTSYYPFYDRPHNITVNFNYQFSKRLNFMTSWVYISGCPYNTPIGKYEINGTTVPMYDLESLHTLRMPSYHHLDLGLQYKFGSKMHYRHSISLCFYNIYFRKNILFYTYRDVYDNDVTKNGDNNVQDKRFNAVGFYLFQFMPAFSYEFKLN